MSFSIGLQDLAKLQKLAAKVGQIGAKVRAAIGLPLYSGATEIMAQSQKIVPVDTGALRSTGLVTRPETVNRKVSVQLQYGGPAAPYAFDVHEDLTMRHHDGQEAKYLEIPVVAGMPQVSAEVWAVYQAIVQRELGGI